MVVVKMSANIGDRRVEWLDINNIQSQNFAGQRAGMSMGDCMAGGLVGGAMLAVWCGSCMAGGLVSGLVGGSMLAIWWVVLWLAVWWASM